MIIEDERFLAEMIALQLRMFGGYETLEAYDGEEGLRYARESHPDLIILDIVMSKMDGLEVFNHLKTNESTRSIPVIFLTASISPVTIGNYTRANDTACIIKPFEPEELMEKINAMLTQGGQVK